MGSLTRLLGRILGGRNIIAALSILLLGWSSVVAAQPTPSGVINGREYNITGCNYSGGSSNAWCTGPVSHFFPASDNINYVITGNTCRPLGGTNISATTASGTPSCSAGGNPISTVSTAALLNDIFTGVDAFGFPDLPTGDPTDPYAVTNGSASSSTCITDRFVAQVGGGSVLPCGTQSAVGASADWAIIEGWVILPSLPAPPTGLPEVIINSSNVGEDGIARTNYVALMASPNSNPANLAFEGEVESQFQTPSSIQLFTTTNVGDPAAPLTCASKVVYLRQYFYDDQSAGSSSLTWSLNGGTSFVPIPSGNLSSTDPSCTTPPVAQDDQQVTPGSPSPGNPVVVAVLQNDTDADDNIDPLTVSLVATDAVDTDMDGDADSLTVPGEGTWSVDGTLGTITFTPVAGFTGNPSPIDYVINDSTGLTSNIARVEIEFLGIAGARAIPTLGASGLVLLSLMLLAVTSLQRRLR